MAERPRRRSSKPDRRVQLPPGTSHFGFAISDFGLKSEIHSLPWPSGNGTWFTPRHIAGSSPAGSIAEGTGVGFQHGPISQPAPVRTRPTQLLSFGERRCVRPPCDRAINTMGLRSAVRMTIALGLEVLRRHTALVRRESGFKSRRDLRGMGCWSKRKTPSSQGGNRGAIPRLSTSIDASVVKRKSCLGSNERVPGSNPGRGIG